MKSYLTPEQVHEEFGIAPKTLANWRSSRCGPRYAKLSKGRSGKVLYKREDLVEWIDQHMVLTADTLPLRQRFGAGK